MEGDPIDKAWAQVEAAWEDDDAHRRFLALCVALERLPEAGQRYRAIRESDPTRREQAQRRIEQLIGFATQKLQETRSDKFPELLSKRSLLLVAFVMMVGLSGISIWLFLRGGL